MIFIAVLAFVAGAVASIAGFGIGSLLTPFLTLQHGASLAIAAVSISHFFGTLLRFFKLKSHVDRKALINFGILSAAGGLTGPIPPFCLAFSFFPFTIETQVGPQLNRNFTERTFL